MDTTTGADHDGPLDDDAAQVIGDADVLVVATADAHGERDIAVLAGPRATVHRLDGRHLAYPDEGVTPMSAGRANLAEEPGIGLLLLGPGADGSRRALHVNGTARVVPDAELRDEHPDLPVDPVAGRATDVWVVVEVGDVYVLEGEDAPPVAGSAAAVSAASPASPTSPTSTASTASPTSPTSPSPTGSGGRPRRGLVAVLAAAVVVLLLALLGTLATFLGSGAGATASPPPPPPADPGPTGPPTLFGRVVDVRDPGTVVTDVGGRPVQVAVIGVDAATIPPCAAADATAFARRTLQGQTVTLVPDPTLPPVPGVTRAYPVLESQLSYSDAVISAGWATPAGPSRYRAVFDRERREAQDAGRGMYGPPCRPGA